MATVYDVEAQTFIEKTAKELSSKESMKAPEWSQFVKTGPAKDRVPANTEWWYVRAASILRKMYKSRGPIGVQKLRIAYGSKKNRGHKPEKFFIGSGKIIRTILQQFEKEEMVKKAEVGVHKGRVLTPKGKSFLDKIAAGLAEKSAAKKPAAPKEKPEPKNKAEEKAEKQEQPAPKKEEKQAAQAPAKNG